MTDSVHSSFDALVRHRSYLNRYAFSRLGHKGAADVVQETLLAAVEGQARFRGESAPLTWLTGILKHKIVDWQRREARNPSRVTAPSRIDMDGDFVEAADALFDSEGRWVNPPSAWPNPDSPRKPAVLGNARTLSGGPTARFCACLLPSRDPGHGRQRDLRRTGHLGNQLLGHSSSRPHEPQTKDRRALVSKGGHAERCCEAQAHLAVKRKRNELQHDSGQLACAVN